MVVERGEIWWACMPIPRGSEPGYNRPVLVIQANDFNKSNISTVLCATITSNLKHSSAPGNVRISRRVSGLNKPSVVNISQLIAMDKRFLIEKVKTLDSYSMNEVDEGLRLILDL